SNNTQDNPMSTWKQFRQSYLDELLRHDGLAGGSLTCAICNDPSKHAEFRCADDECVGLGLVCQECCLAHHLCLPLHWIQRWNNGYFEHCSLQSLGLVVQLGHLSGSSCLQRHATVTNFTVLHTNGVHTVSLFFCGCTTSPSAYVQLLRTDWWPATPLEPRTVVTFSLLRLFHYLNTMGKLPCWDMWKGLEAMTLNRSSVMPPNRYRVLLRTVRQFRHITMLKRAGRGHDPSGVDGTNLGELALQCPACPQPGINLPSNWKTSIKHRFLYRLFVGIDANFRTRNALVSTPERDPPLGDGWSYFVPRDPYLRHVRTHVTEDDISSCSGFKAMFLANLKNVRGLRTTGVVGVTCSRHGLWRAHGMGDLQRGERYCNVDPPVAATLKMHDLEVVMSYDIMCNYGKHFWERVEELPEEWRVDRDRAQRVLCCIPKFHLWAHKPVCHAPYSFNYVPGVGRTDGEQVERNWADSNRAAAQTKMMGPGARQDTLEDIFGAHNFRAIQSFARMFLRRLAEAIKEAHTHGREFDDFSAGLETLLGKSVLDSWTREIVAWERDHTAPCPYESQLPNQDSLKEIELKLLKEEQEALVRAGGVAHECIFNERFRRSLAWEVKARRSGATYQKFNIEKQRGVITRMLRRIRGLQQVFMPHVREYLTAQQLVHLDSPGSVLPEETKLFLPSELKKRDRVLDRACVPGLVDAEIRLREGECREALESLRQGLRTRSATHMFTVRNVTGQNPTTRAEGIQRKIQIGIQLDKLRYRWARNALFQLKGHGEWENELRAILDPASSDAVVAPGEGRRQLSWLWYSPSEIGGDTNIESLSALKIEWSKARARKLRWHEEVELVLEEMRRVIAYQEWQGRWWLMQMDQREVSAELQQGIWAFAMEQAGRAAGRANDLEGRWRELR
ncbi:hypothetical protein BDZ89DRAFT_924767, partial [Hymenopellis radicata]